MTMRARAVAVVGVVLAGLGGFFLLARSPAGPSASGDRAQVTGYAASDLFAAKGPVSVQLRGASAARIEQIVEGLPRATLADICNDNWELYRIAFTAAAGAQRGFDLTGYACGRLVVETPASGLNRVLIDQNCALLAAVREALPASATVTRAAATRAMVCGSGTGR
jgi:hypothetical protein